MRHGKAYGYPCLTGSVAVAGLGLVSAAGDGADATLRSVEANRIALHACTRHLDGPYMTNIVGRCLIASGTCRVDRMPIGPIPAPTDWRIVRWPRRFSRRVRSWPGLTLGG